MGWRVVPVAAAVGPRARWRAARLATTATTATTARWACGVLPAAVNWAAWAPSQLWTLTPAGSDRPTVVCVATPNPGAARLAARIVGVYAGTLAAIVAAASAPNPVTFPAAALMAAFGSGTIAGSVTLARARVPRHGLYLQGLAAAPEATSAQIAAFLTSVRRQLTTRTDMVVVADVTSADTARLTRLYRTLGLTSAPTARHPRRMTTTRPAQ